ncbi:ATP synthase subunit a [Aeromicrobium flavum]|uniref:ATP synthase subunit a n=1 Tax=Aeromicrobium flavum TaxID=416568 RepID=A0A512HXC8_9ACTN|nr:ATP synthase subunit a [Aeromicrobium flavum]
MSSVTTTVLNAASDSEGGFTAPGPASFELPPVFSIGDFDVTKPMLLLALSVPLIVGFFWAASKNKAVVPGRLQFVGEYVYGFVRNGVARDSIGSHDFLKFVPLLFALFTFVLVNNYFSLIPFLQFPSFSRFGFVVPLALLVWVVYNGVGVARHGLVGYLKHVTVPGGIKGPILALIIPLEFLSTILVRPATLALRLFANMFAGHLLLILFATGAAYLILDSGNPWYAPVGVLSFVMGILVSFLELLVLFLQAYVFTLLTAMYIGGALADEH